MKNSIVLREKLVHALGDNSHVRGIRGKGYMLGIQLDKPALELRLRGLANGILLNVTAESVIRLLPPLIMSDEETDELVTRLVKSVHDFYRH